MWTLNLIAHSPKVSSYARHNLQKPAEGKISIDAWMVADYNRTSIFSDSQS